MKKRILSLMLVLALCLGSALPALAVGDASKAGGYRQTIYTSASSAWAIREDNSLWGWGINDEGQLGNGGGGNDKYNALTCQTVPVKIMDNVATISAGGYVVMAVKTDGTLWSWGWNDSGELGDGTLEKRYTPRKIMDNVATVSVGGDHVLAVKTDGSLWAWGNNRLGQLGNGGDGNETVTDYNHIEHVDGMPRFPTMTVQTVPVKIMDGVAAASAGSRYSLAVKTDGTLWAWGSNPSGELGDGTKEGKSTPIKIMDGVAAVSAGADHSMAIKTDGTLWVWGCNLLGQLGNGGGGSEEVESHLFSIDGKVHYMWIQTMPVKVMDGVSAISAGDEYSFAVKTDGTLWAWGNNLFYSLGDGTKETQLTPVKTMDGVSAVCTGNDIGMAVKTDGTLWGWGINSFGVLGLENIGRECSPPIHITDNVKLPTASAPTPSTPTAPSAPSTPATSAVLSPQKLAVDGKNIDCEKYNIGGSNYFKLRDLAQLLNGTGSQFGVGYDAASSTVTITTGEAYMPAGGELAAGVDNSATARPSSQAILIDGVKHDELTVYNIGGSNFFQLRELGNVLGFDVGYDQDTDTAVVRSK